MAEIVDYGSNSIKSRKAVDITNNSGKKRQIANGHAEKEEKDNIFKDTGKYVFKELIVPGLLKLLGDAAHGAINSLIFKEHSTSSTGNKEKKTGYQIDGVSYVNNTYVSKRLTLKNIEFETEREAFEVLDAMKEIIEMDGACCVADYYELSLGDGSVIKNSDYDYGWRSLRSAEIIRNRRNGAYKIELPTVRQL